MLEALKYLGPALGAKVPDAGTLWLAGLYVALALGGGLLLASLLLFVLKHWASRTDTHVDDAIVDLMPTPLRLLGALICARFVLPLVGLPPQYRSPLSHGLLVLTILASGWVLVKAVRVFE
ncbi:MAG TPA: hypothetical protein PKA88_30595, partial [Polyangiaceae bacterium]|nr:hypothetical protein [Polyangiaceae bacterium]